MPDGTLPEILQMFSHGSLWWWTRGEARKQKQRASLRLLPAAVGFLLAERVKLAVCHRHMATDDGLDEGKVKKKKKQAAPLRAL